MNIDELNALISHGESETLEFKKSTAQLQSAMQTVCAFLNGKHGGKVLIGVNDGKKILGQVIADKTRKGIAAEINKIEPHVNLDVVYAPIDQDRSVIVLDVPPGIKAPYVYDGRAFVRNQSTTIRMPQEKYEQLLHGRKSPSVSWEHQTSNDCDVADLDHDRIQQFVHLAISEKRLSELAIRASVPEVLSKLKLLGDSRLNNAAVILFCKNPQKQFIQSSLRLARFKGVDKREFIDNKSIQGNAFDLYEQAMGFLNTYLPVAGKIEEGNPFRIDTPAVPVTVLREALVNALCHRNYSLPGGAIHLAI